MEPDYLHLIPDHGPPSIGVGPFRAVMIAEQSVSDAWRDEISTWLIESGCLYFVVWGVDCEAWHDEVDWALLEAHDFGEIPDERFVMTSWHDKQPLSEALWFAGHFAYHSDIDLQRTVILHVAQDERRDGVLDAFRIAQETTDI